MKLGRDTIKSNWKYFAKRLPKAENDDNYARLLAKYESLENPLWNYKKVVPHKDFYFCSFHTHSDGYTREELAKSCIANGLDLVFIVEHDKDRFFEGKQIIYHKEEDKGVYLVRGMEYDCRDKDKLFWKFNWPVRTKMLFTLYEGEAIEKKRPLVEAVTRFKEKGAIVMAPSTLHTGSHGGISRKNINLLMSDPATRIHALETLDSGYGFFGRRVNRHYWACADAEEVAEEYGLASFFAANDHIEDERGTAGVFIPKKSLTTLESPEIVLKNPRLLRDQLLNVLETRDMISVGYYSPVFGFARPERLRIALGDMFHSWKRKLHHAHGVVDMRKE